MHLDLNLLTVLEALVEEGSVAGAAARLRLSSPAVSRSLGRIRRLTGDEILVRTGRTMTRTPYALAVRDDVGELLRQAGQLLAPSGSLDLATLERVFTLRAHDALTAAIAPALVSDVLRSAPGVRLRFLTETPHSTDDLRHAVVDLELGSSVPNAPELRHDVLGRDPLLVVLRRGHPAAARLNVPVYAALPHVVVSRRGRLADPVDDALAEHDAQRLVVASVGTIAAAAQIVAGTDAVLTAPGGMIDSATAAFDLLTTPIPLNLPSPQVVSVWHQRSDSDAAHAWLRERVRVAVKGLLNDVVLTPSNTAASS
ncbi:LysR substrate-binding domain-containing protein [Curtobacterium sp. MWU13-2055]|uniref:LysR substrate-binding domain-containing protein n=1 Tax=Curtobacterium sp. MWU13-2055 TaxID=2931928 RepID=UPI00200E4D10|nr:LysR substrate-binding domain-containing protein [Curtobacterium sp. MWU13-2055]